MFRVRKDEVGCAAFRYVSEPNVVAETSNHCRVPPQSFVICQSLWLILILLRFNVFRSGTPSPPQGTRFRGCDDPSFCTLRTLSIFLLKIACLASYLSQ